MASPGLPQLKRRMPASQQPASPEAKSAADSVDDHHCFDCEAPLAIETPWVSVSYGIYICLNCAGNHRSLGVHISFVRSVGLDTLTTREKMSLALGGNKAFAAFLADPERGVSRKVWLALPTQTRYFTPAADLYKRQLAAALGAEDASTHVAAEAMPSSSDGTLAMDTAVRPPPPAATQGANTPPRWTANREAPKCELCKSEFNVFKWRHHCRRCGRCVCAECSPKESWIPQPDFFGHADEVRHCKLCVAPTRPMIGM